MVLKAKYKAQNLQEKYHHLKRISAIIRVIDHSLFEGDIPKAVKKYKNFLDRDDILVWKR